VLSDIGGFGSFFRFPKGRYKDPVLVSSSDGVGTKLKIANLARKHNTVGIDAVAMNVNDILCAGAQPLFFLDYIAYSKVSPGVLLDLVGGLNSGCIESGCSLIGGETAQMPGMYKDGEYDLAGFCVGIVERNNIINGSRIRDGDKIIGLESSGLHSNGFSLVRKVFSQNELKRMSDELLKPTRIYVKPILSLLREPRAKSQELIRGIAHITGGAFYDKIARILPDNLTAKINKDSWVVPKIFKLVQNKANIDDREIYHTLNMGIGMVLVVRPGSEKAVISALAASGLKSWVIGQVLSGKKQVEII
jgi:phosphoribosylformylglycinamidine cyclo-ligase